MKYVSIIALTVFLAFGCSSLSWKGESHWPREVKTKRNLYLYTPTHYNSKYPYELSYISIETMPGDHPHKIGLVKSGHVVIIEGANLAMDLYAPSLVKAFGTIWLNGKMYKFQTQYLSSEWDRWFVDQRENSHVAYR